MIDLEFAEAFEFAIQREGLGPAVDGHHQRMLANTAGHMRS